MKPATTDAIALAGRVLLAVLFIGSGLGKAGAYQATAQYMAASGVPAVSALLPLTILVEVGAGLLLALGYKARWAALVLFLFLIPVTLVFHAFWGLDPQAAQMQQMHFMKNVAIMGGMLVVLALGPGRWSLERG